MSETAEGRRTRRRRGGGETAPARKTDYRQLRNPFPVMSIFSDDEARAMHDTALRTLEELGMRVLLPEARRIFAAAGARGIVRMFELLENEVISALGLAGAASFKDLTPAHLHFGEPLVTEPSVFSAFPLLNLDDPGYGGR